MTYAADLISCRMYHGSIEAVNGFTKNLFAAFNFRLLPFVFVFAWLAVMFLKPITSLLLMITGPEPQTQAINPMICIGLSVLLWLIPYIELGITFWPGAALSVHNPVKRNCCLAVLAKQPEGTPVLEGPRTSPNRIGGGFRNWRVSGSKAFWRGVSLPSSQPTWCYCKGNAAAMPTIFCHPEPGIADALTSIVTR